jgi:hypothetical protein
LNALAPAFLGEPKQEIKKESPPMPVPPVKSLMTKLRKLVGGLLVQLNKEDLTELMAAEAKVNDFLAQNQSELE